MYNNDRDVERRSDGWERDGGCSWRDAGSVVSFVLERRSFVVKFFWSEGTLVPHPSYARNALVMSAFATGCFSSVL